MYKCNQKVFHFSYFFFPSFYHHQTIRVSSLPLNFQQPTNQASVLASCYCSFNLQPHYSFFKKKKSTYQQWFPAARVFLPTASVLLKLAARAARAPPASAPARAPRRKTPLARPAALVACATPRSAPVTGLPLRMGLETARLTSPTPFKSGHQLPIF